MAGTEVGALYYDLNIDDKNLKSQLDSADRNVKGFGDRVNKYWGDSVDASKKLGLAIAAIGAGIVAFGVSSVKAFEDSQNKIAQTNAVLKSTGQAAGVTADQVTKLATALERQTKFSDEDVRSVENLLLTFTSIGKDIFPQATSTVLDMATALGEDTASASIQLGKALQDPILGVTALRRVGVNFNSAQQDVIKNLVATGRSAEAQKLILAELHKEFGGSAVAAGDTFAGKLAKLNNQFNNVQEAVGQIIVVALGPLVDWFAKVTDAIQKQGGLLKVLENFYHKNKTAITIAAGAIGGALVPALTALAGSLLLNLLYLSPFIALGGALAYAWNNNKALFWGLVSAVSALALGIGIKLIPSIIKATSAFAGPAVKMGLWVAQAALTGAAWTAQFAIMSAKAIAHGVVQATQATAAGAIWAAKALVASAAWTAQFLVMVAKATPAAIVMALKAADAGVAWVINASVASTAWVVTELPKIVAAGAVTAVQSSISAVRASAAWVAQAIVSSTSWVVTELPKIVGGFIVTAGAAALQASISSGAWVVAAAASSAIWVVTELPKIVAGFVVLSGAAVVNAAIASAAWIAAAVASSAAWIASIVSTSATFGALSSLVAIPLVMPALAVGAAIAAIATVWDKIVGTQHLLDQLQNQAAQSVASNSAALQQIIDNYHAGKITKAQEQKLLNGLAGNAAGTDYWQGGLTWVGEKGKELVNLPRGAQIFPNDISEKLAGAFSAPRNISQNVISKNVSTPSITTQGSQNTGQTLRGGDTIFNIGQINNDQDEAKVVRLIDRNQQLQTMGVSPV